jgi:hypothetical protein
MTSTMTDPHFRRVLGLAPLSGPRSAGHLFVLLVHVISSLRWFWPVPADIR